jgi:hypothetical protein
VATPPEELEPPPVVESIPDEPGEVGSVEEDADALPL